MIKTTIRELPEKRRELLRDLPEAVRQRSRCQGFAGVAPQALRLFFLRSALERLKSGTPLRPSATDAEPAARSVAVVAASSEGTIVVDSSAKSDGTLRLDPPGGKS